MDGQNEEVKTVQTSAQDQPQWHAPQLQCFDAKDAESGGPVGGWDGMTSSRS